MKLNPISVIRHIPFEGLGRIAPALDRTGIPFHYFDVFAGAQPPEPEDSGGLILMGGPMSANDNQEYLKTELRLIDATVRAGRPVLGICLGAQLIAKALGGRVFRNPTKEIGWYPLHLTRAAASDALLAGLPNPSTVLQWHGETFDLPPGAEHLAWSELCRNQAFRYGSQVYGFQFHLETTPDMIADWCRQDANCGDVRELREPIDPSAFDSEQEQAAELVFSRWASLASHAG
ncbi:MAG TPA: gamma-glutamyl-gamma-aminobutyrate hydrolase family protein [Bryobacteraceae bacterium]|nr:gamma-glutamyl-gamma-aminobutyrate hydrolase family protein [Bryobacteraceae bacterium]